MEGAWRRPETGRGGAARRAADARASRARPGDGALRLPAAGRGRPPASAGRAASPRDLARSVVPARWDLDRDDWRLFSADRVRPRVPHGAPLLPRVVPGGDVDTFVSAQFKGSDTNEWPCRGTVLLHAPAREVLPFAGDGTVTAVDDERFEVAMEVVEPPELAEAFAVQAARFAAAGPSVKKSRRGS